MSDFGQLLFGQKFVRWPGKKKRLSAPEKALIGATHGSQLPPPLIVPLGDQALLVRFGAALSEDANLAAIGLARAIDGDRPVGVREVVPSLVSVLVTYDPLQISADRLAGELRLMVGRAQHAVAKKRRKRTIAVRYGGADGPDLVEVAAALRMSPEELVARHCGGTIRVLATGFAPGFVYCGFHPSDLRLPRRTDVRPEVPPGSILFAVGQTAIAATAIPTGWHVIGRTEFRNFDPDREPPTLLAAGNSVGFKAVS